MNFDQRTMPTILCCMCGIAIPSNPSNMCVNCVRSQVDITEGIPKQLTAQMCKNCNRWLNPPAQWVNAELESKELLAICIKRIRGLNKVKLIDAGFVWTEPHSRRLKVKLTIQKEVFTSTILQQVFIIEYVVQTQQCDACQKYYAKDTWTAVVQLRQKVEHKRTFFWLEQLILKHNAHMSTINVKQVRDGLDFFYSQRSHAIKFVEFLNALIPIRYKTSERLISQDDNNNTYNYKFTYSVEIVPVCREDLVCLPTKVAAACGSISPLVLCYKVSNQIHIVDPYTLRVSEFSSQTFWLNNFRSIASHKNMIEYTILDIVPTGHVNGKYVLADVTVARSRDFGANDQQFVGRTHLGHLLKPGDTAMGYDLSTAIFNDADLVPFRGKNMPDFMLVRKSYGEKRKKRIFTVKTLDKEIDEDAMRRGDEEREQNDMDEFLNDIEDDPEFRQQMNLYKVKGAEKIIEERRRMAEDNMEDYDNDEDEIGLEDLIEDLNLDDE